MGFSQQGDPSKKLLDFLSVSLRETGFLPNNIEQSSSENRFLSDFQRFVCDILGLASL